MQENKRVYPNPGQGGKWISYLLLFLSAVIVFSGIARRGADQPTLEPVISPTPIPLEESFDETRETRELALGGVTWHALQLGAFENEASAREVAEKYRLRGAAGYVWTDGRHRALAALYPTVEDAQNVRQQLSAQHSIETYLFEIPLPALTVRMSGMRGQIELLEAAFAHANDLVAALQDFSVRMDRQEMNVSEAREAIAALGAQMELVTTRLFQRFPSPRNATVQGLLALFEDYAAFCENQTGSEDAVMTAQRLKYQAIHSLWLQKSVMNTLGNT